MIVAEHPAGEAVNPGDVRPVDAFERRRVSASREGDVGFLPGSVQHAVADHGHNSRYHGATTGWMQAGRQRLTPPAPEKVRLRRSWRGGRASVSGQSQATGAPPLYTRNRQG